MTLEAAIIPEQNSVQTVALKPSAESSPLESFAASPKPIEPQSKAIEEDTKKSTSTNSEESNVQTSSAGISFVPVYTAKPSSSPDTTDKKSDSVIKLNTEDGLKSQPADQVKVSSSPSVSAPNQSASGIASNIPTICQNCQTSTTPLWRRDESGQILCNACGLFLKLHGRARPISLKTNIIKSRNRARNSSSQSKRKQIQSPILISNVSPSCPAISPHLTAHGSPLRPAPGGHDLHQIDHLSMALSPSMAPQTSEQHTTNSISLSQNRSLSNQILHHSQLQHHPNGQKSHRQPPHRHPTTPSSIFSYPSGQGTQETTNKPQRPTPLTSLPKLPIGSPNFGYHNSSSLNSGGPDSPKLTPLRNGEATRPRGYHPSGPNMTARPPALVVGSAGTPGFSATTPQFNADSPRQSEDHHLPKLPTLSALAALATEAEEQRAISKIIQAPRPPITQHMPPQLTSTDGTSPQILTPQSRPQSRPQSPLLPGSNMYISKVAIQDGAVRLSAKGEAMSEQLRPRYGEESLDKIPSLRHLVSDRFPPSSPGGNQYLQMQVLSSLTQQRPRLSKRNERYSEDHHADNENASLKTRVSELELVNDLLRSRVTQLEYSESNIRESELILRRKLFEMEEKNKKLMRKIKNIFTEERETRRYSDLSDDPSPDYQDSPHASKKKKVSDVL